MTANEKKIIDELKAVPITDKTREEIRWNIAEQQFLVRLINLRDEAAKEEMYDALAEVIAAQNKRMFEALEEQTKIITAIAIDVSDIKIHLDTHDAELKRLNERLYIVERKIKSLSKKID